MEKGPPPVTIPATLLKKKQIRLGGRSFKSWNQARTTFNRVVKESKSRAIERGAPFCEKIKPDHKEWDFVKAMFSMLPSKRSKLNGQKLQYFAVKPEHGDSHNESGNWCCYVVNAIGQEEKWSARTIGKAKKKVTSDLHRSVFRIEISCQADAWAKTFPYVVPCAICECNVLNTKTKQPKILLSTAAGGGGGSAKRGNVDHDVHKGQAFLTSFLQFKKKIGNQPIKIKWSKKYGRKIPRLQDRKLASQWQRYHKKHTVFRFLCVKCNQQSENKPKREK